MDADAHCSAQAMPQYLGLLNFAKCIVEFQTALRERIKPGPRIELAIAQERWRAGQPLFASEPLSISPSLVQEALVGLRSVLPPGEAVQTTLDRLLASHFMTTSNVAALLDDLLADSETCIQRLAERTSTDPDAVAFLLRTVLSPFFEKQTAPYQEWVEMVDWRQGICPMCGSEPWMARLAHQDGRRTLACSLCHTEWRFDRLRCPFCEDDGQPLVHHFTVDDDEAHRVDCCNRCHRYIKTVDERVWGRPANLMVEDVITAHLDALAREQGYR